MRHVTPRCSDLAGPRELVIVTDDGWVPFNRETAHELAVSGMLLAYSPEHVERLRDQQISSDPALDTHAA